MTMHDQTGRRAMHRQDLETALFAFCGIAQVAFLLMLRHLWGNDLDLRIWAPALSLPAFVAAASALTAHLLRRRELGVGFDGQALVVVLGLGALVVGLGPWLNGRLTALVEMAIVGVALGLAAAVGWQLRELRRSART